MTTAAWCPEDELQAERDLLETYRERLREADLTIGSLNAKLLARPSQISIHRHQNGEDVGRSSNGRGSSITFSGSCSSIRSSRDNISSNSRRSRSDRSGQDGDGSGSVGDGGGAVVVVVVVIGVVVVVAAAAVMVVVAMAAAAAIVVVAVVM